MPLRNLAKRTRKQLRLFLTKLRINEYEIE